MWRHSAFAVILAFIALGCAARSPILPEVAEPGSNSTAQVSYDERYRLWGEYTWYIPETHDRIDVVPRRTPHFHCNLLKWLEESCPDCLSITGVRKNPDSTMDVTVMLRHPRPGQPELTGFDVKGIIMFEGSYELPCEEFFPPYPDPVRISWKEMGDPELLNPDGYTVRWSPTYDSGSSLPLLNYWPGKFSNGTPTANLNGYLDFYIAENRHMFTHSGVASRMYHIYVPPGPLVVGYAVEACWVPPDTYPVKNPAEDFPISANQEEPYYFRYVVNNGEPIEAEFCCGDNDDDPCSDLRIDVLQWSEPMVRSLWLRMPPDLYSPHTGGGLRPCLVSHTESLRAPSFGFGGYPDGTYRCVAAVYYRSDWPFVWSHVAYTVFDFTVDNG